MAALKMLIALLFSLQLATSLVIGAHNTTTSLERTLTVQSFPPQTPTSVKLNLIIQFDAVVFTWIWMTIGTTDYKLFFDTGSGITWVMSKDIVDRKYRNNRKYTIKQKKECDFGIYEYGDGTEISGYYQKENTVVSESTRDKYKFLAATKIEDDRDFFGPYEIDGIFGANAALATDYPESEDRPVPWFSGTKFRISIDRSGSSTVAFGVTDLDSAVVLSVDKEEGPNWIVQSTSLGRVLIDIGAPVLRLPSGFVKDYMANVKAWAPNSEENESDDWLVDCNEPLPDMKIDFKGKEIVISGSRLRMPPDDDESGSDEDSDEDEEKDAKCGVWILVIEEKAEQPGNQARETIEGAKTLPVLGMPLFWDNDVAFDSGNRKIGVSHH